jgi:RNA polymerase sigma-70 factor (ECF subfamily)
LAWLIFFYYNGLGGYGPKNFLIPNRPGGRRPEFSIDSVVDTLRHDEGMDADHSHDLERGLANLPPRQRDVLVAVSLQGCSAQEAALQLGMSEVGVRVTLHRALKSLGAFFSRGDA